MKPERWVYSVAHLRLAIPGIEPRAASSQRSAICAASSALRSQGGRSRSGTSRHQRRISESRRIFWCTLRDTAGCATLTDRLGAQVGGVGRGLFAAAKYTVTPRPLSLVCSMVSVSPRRTVTDRPVWVGPRPRRIGTLLACFPQQVFTTCCSLLSVPDDSCVMDGSGSSAADIELIDFQGGLADADRHL